MKKELFLGKDVIFIVLDRLVPASWLGTLDSVKEVRKTHLKSVQNNKYDISSLQHTNRTATAMSVQLTQRGLRLTHEESNSEMLTRCIFILYSN